MAVTFNNVTTTAGPASVGTKTILFTATAGSTLLVWTHANTAISISGIQANNMALTRLGHVSASSSRAEVWGLTAPPAGVLSISANTVAAASLNFCLVAIGYVGHRQIGGSPFGTVALGTATGATANLSVSSTSTDLVVFGFGASANLAVVLNNGTNRADITHSTTGRLVIGDIAGAATVSISATANGAGTVWSMIGVPIIASAAQTTSIRFDNAAFTATSGAVNNVGLLLTATAGATLLVFVSLGGGAQTISTMAINATPLTFLGGINFEAGTKRAEIWGLTAPPTGTLTISASCTGPATNFAIAAVTYTGHKTTATPFGGVVVGSAAAAVSASLIVSSTIGNICVFGFAVGDPNDSAMPGLTQRTVTNIFPYILIADGPGFLAATGVAATGAAGNWGNLGINLIQSGPAVNITGNFLATDINDTFVGTGAVRITGRLSATDVIDKFSASGGVRITGLLAATDVVGTFSASGGVRVTGRLSATDTLDTFSASGGVRITARLSATDVIDRFSASGNLLVQGRLSATDTLDTFSASGGVRITGLLSATDVTDRFSASGTLVALGGVITGLLVATDAPDIFTGIGTVVPSADAVVVQQDRGSGGGHKKEYVRASELFWEVRAKYLESLQPAIASEPDPAVFESTPVDDPLPVASPIILAAYRVERTTIIDALPLATNITQLRAHGTRLVQVNTQIAQQKYLQQLADERTERFRQRAILRRKARKEIRLLTSALALAALSTIYTE